MRVSETPIALRGATPCDGCARTHSHFASASLRTQLQHIPREIGFAAYHSGVLARAVHAVRSVAGSNVTAPYSMSGPTALGFIDELRFLNEALLCGWTSALPPARCAA
jgi:hypothetical protein